MWADETTALRSRIEDVLKESLKILAVAGDECKAPDLGSGCDESVVEFDGVSGFWLRATDLPQASAISASINKIRPEKTWEQLLAQPSVKPGLLLPWRQPLEAIANFGNRHHGDMSAVLVGLSESLHYPGIRLGFHRFGNHIGVEQAAHSSTLRMRPGRRRIFTPDPRSGEAGRNSARLPLRAALRSH